MLGAVVGDVIGSPFEQHNVKSTGFRLFDRRAQCTDDSVLTVATADALLATTDGRTRTISTASECRLRREFRRLGQSTPVGAA